MKFQVIVLFAILHYNYVHGGRILAVIGTNLNSHFQVFKSVVEHLSPYHDITFYMDAKFNYKNPNVTVRHVNARHIEINTSRIFENACNMDMYEVFYENILTINETSIDEVWSKSHALIYANETYDLFLVSGYGTDHFFQLAHRFNVPIVQVTPSVLMNWHNEAVNNPYSWINDFSFMINENTETFTGRLKKYIKNAMINYRFFWGHMKAINSVTKKYFPPGTPLVEEVLKKTDLILVNTHNVMGYARPNVPLVVEIGGLHIKPYKPLPNDLEEFISGSGEHGFIYFSLGTLVQESTVSENVVQAFLNVFRKLPQRVLWKWNGKMRNVPSNVKISKWFPQSDILGHKKIKLFILQGGMLSMQEAIYNGVPVLIMPVLFDQFSNAYLAEQKGYGRSLTFCDFTQELFDKHVNALLQNTSYSENVRQISRVMKDQNKLVSERVNWWINFVIRHKGTSVLRPTIKYESWTDIPYDIFSFFMFIASCILYLSLYIVLYMFRYVIRINTYKCKKE